MWDYDQCAVKFFLLLPVISTLGGSWIAAGGVCIKFCLWKHTETGWEVNHFLQEITFRPWRSRKAMIRNSVYIKVLV